MKLAIAMVLSAVYLTGCVQSAESHLAACKMDALKSFHQLREVNGIGMRNLPSTFELDFLDYCMRANGFELDFKKVESDYPDPKRQYEIVLRYMYLGNEKYWKRKIF